MTIKLDNFQQFINTQQSNTTLACNTKAIQNFNINQNQQSSKDVFINSQKTKTIIKYGAMAGAILALGILAKKGIETNKLKQEITDLFNSKCDEVADYMEKAGFNFEKPKLCFKNTGDAIAQYDISHNVVRFNKKHLSLKTLVRYNDLEKVSEQTIQNADKTKQFSIFEPYFSRTYHMKISEKVPLSSKEEFMLNTEAVLSHELTHAKQTQIALSSEDVLNRVISIARKRQPKLQNINDEKVISSLKKNMPFIFSYKPKKIIDYNMPITNILGSDKDYIAKYSPKQALEFLFDNKSSKYDYYLNMAEIEAKMAEAVTFKKYFTGAKESNLPNNLLEWLYMQKDFTVKSLCEAFKNK